MFNMLSRSLSFNRNSAAHLEDNPVRQYLHGETQNGVQPFTQSVHMVNANLASHGDQQLPDWKAQQYVHHARAVESGEMSNSFAFASSANGWLKERNWVGTMMNVGGTLLAGAFDDRKMRTGRVIWG